jgi:uncharacterized protein YbjT (DUF2867 family)
VAAGLHRWRLEDQVAKTVLVLGATGFIGRSLVTALCDAGETVRSASRRPPEREVPNTRWVHCDLSLPETIDAALDGVDVAYYLVHSVGSGKDFRTRERLCAGQFGSAVENSNCRRVVYLGGVAPRGRPSEHLASRLEVGEILRAGMVPAIELRASMIVGNGSASWRILRDLAARLPFMVLPRWLESKTCPIALPDVITALLDAREVPLAGSAWFDIPGPDVLSMREMLAIVAELDGRRVPFVRVPLLTPKLSSLWLKLVSGADYALARELVLGLTEDLLPRQRFSAVTGHAPRWTFRDAAAHALAAETPPTGLALTLERLVRRMGPHLPAGATT